MTIKKLWSTYRDSIKIKLIVNIVLIHAILMGFIVVDLLEREQSFMEKQLSQKSHDLASILSTSVTVPLLNNDLVAIGELLKDGKDISSINLIFILDKNLKVKASTQKKYFLKTLVDDTSIELVQMLKKSGKSSVQKTHHNLIDTLHVVKVNNVTIGYVRTILDRKELLGELKVITNKGIIYILLAIFIGAIFAWLSIRTMTKNLKIVSLASQKISKKDFNIDLEEPTNNDEIAKMIRAFKVMSESIQSHLCELENKNAKIYSEKKLAEITLSSIADCVIVTNESGIVKFINPPAQKILQYSNEEASGKKIDELFKIYDETTKDELPSSFYEVLKTKKAINNDFSVILINKNGEKFFIERSASPIKNINNSIEGVIIVFYDITEKRKALIEIKWNAMHDTLTRLNSRISFEIELNSLIKRVKIDKTSNVFLFMDLDHFKIVNDSVGHLVGDRVLKDVANILKNEIRDNDFIFRFGGDEFGVILYDCTVEMATKVTQNLIDKVLGYTLNIDNKTFKIGLSVGMTEVNETHNDFATILSAADFACYIAKDMGRNRYHIANENDYKKLNKEFGLDWIEKINDAIREKRLVLHIQKIKDLYGNDNHYEILLRMTAKDGHLIYPDTFLPHAQRYSLMPKIDRYVIETFFAWFSKNGVYLGDLSFSINITGQSISEPDFADNILDLTKQYNIDTKKIIFEVTETTAVENLDNSVLFFNTLRDKGFRFSLDDFGTGLSSFEYLKSMPISFLKIDGVFVKDILDDKIDRGMIEAIYNIGSLMGLKIVAEYAENDEIIKELKNIGIHYAQGYAIEKPHPIEDLSPHDCQ